MSTDHEYDQGVVFSKTTGHYTVRSGLGEFVCVLSSRLRKTLLYPTAHPASLPHVVRGVRAIEGYDPVAVGDQVEFFQSGPSTGMITRVLPRRTVLSRPAAMPGPGARPFEQVIVANPDQVVPVFSVTAPSPKWPLLDRYLVSAESSGLPSIICITKMDLDPPASTLGQVLSAYHLAGYRVICLSTVTGQGFDELKEALSGRLSVFVGKSGVGKTSLLNHLQPGLGLRVSAVGRGRLGKGCHTTTSLQMFPLESGGFVVDTPGIREFGLWNVDSAGLASCFPEMRPFVGRCRFGLGCRHDTEPGCAIRRAVMDGHINPLRYQSLIHLQEET